MRVRPLLKLVPPIAVPLLALAWVCPRASAQVPSRTVLAIIWGAEDFPGTPELNAAIREAVRSGADDAPVNYFAEYLESETFPSSSPALRDYIRKKYANRRIDVVVAITVAALDFTLLHRAELFPDAPIVFSVGTVSVGVANRRIPGVTGVVSDVTFAETLDVALRLHPSVRRVFVVAQAPTVANYREGIRAALSRFSGRVELTFMTERTVPRLLAAISALPSGSLILYTRYISEGADDGVDTVEVARLMVQRSPVPIYSPNDLYMGTGVVGGVMRNADVTGTRVGAMVRQILDGRRPDDIPIERAKREPTFDWRQLRRWRIDASLLPAGSDIQFRTPTGWETYRWYIPRDGCHCHRATAADCWTSHAACQEAHRREHCTGTGGVPASELRTDSAAGRPADQRTGGGARGHRPGLARRRVSTAGLCLNERQQPQELFGRYSGRRNAGGVFTARTGHVGHVRRPSSSVARLAPGYLASPRPRARLEGALRRGGEAAHRRGELQHRRRDWSPARGSPSLPLSGCPGVAPK